MEHVPVSSREEHFWVKRAGETIVLSSNRPLFRNKGLKHRRGDYEVISGQMHNIGLFNKIVDAIEAKKDLWRVFRRMSLTKFSGVCLDGLVFIDRNV